MKNTSRLVAADDRGLPMTMLIAGVLVVLFDVGLHFLVTKDAWTYDFFFKRSFVQWVLISAFAVGLVHLARRLSPWLSEKRALRLLHEDQSKLTFDTLVGRRWLQIRTAREEHGRKNLGQYAKSLAEHDEAEVDAAYRVSGDVVQILPLIGFFGTVFGLSHGLYKSFLATGGTNTKDFAKAIAIAFDNTLLGLALTIILFVFQSILRKREEAVLMQLNLQASDDVAQAVQEPMKDPLQVAIGELSATLAKHELAINANVLELEKSRKVLESPSDGLKDLVQSHTTAVAKSVFQEIALIQKAEQEKIAQSIMSQLEKQAKGLLDLVDQRTVTLPQLPKFANSVDEGLTALKEHAKSLLELVDKRTATLSQLPQLAGSFNEGLASLKTELLAISNTTRSVSDQIAELAKNTTRPQLEQLADALRSLGSVLAQRDEAMLERLRALAGCCKTG
jgi:biopolymer transport protein ExbB/TolQ